MMAERFWLLDAAHRGGDGGWATCTNFGAPMRLLKSKAIVGVAVGIFSLAGVVLLWPARPPVRVTWTAFDQIEQGMTRQEVNEIIGGPPGLYGEPVGRPYEFRIYRSANDPLSLLEIDSDDLEFGEAAMASTMKLNSDFWVVTEKTTVGYRVMGEKSERKADALSITAIRIKFDSTGVVIEKRFVEAVYDRQPTRFEKWWAWLKEKLGLN